MTRPPLDFDVHARRQPGHRLLFLAASARGTLISLATELTAIRTEVERTPRGHDLEFDVWPAVTLDEMKRQIVRLRWDVVHFCGAGAQEGLMVGAPHEEPTLVPIGPFARMFATLGTTLSHDRGERPVRLVFLNACNSFEQAEALQPHVPCVIGVKGEVPQETAWTFAQWFYGGVAYGRDVNTAFAVAVSQTASDSEGATQFHLLQQFPGTAASTFLIPQPCQV